MFKHLILFILVCNSISSSEQKLRVNRHIPFRIKSLKCGQVDPNELLENLNNTENVQFPWTVAIKETDERIIYRCGGSLIHPSVVLTSVECVQGKMSQNLEVNAGRWSTDITSDDWPHQKRNVSKIIIHTNYNRSIFDNDFALLILSTSFTLSDNINTICLPDSKITFTGSLCFSNNYVGIAREYFSSKFLKTKFRKIIPRLSKLKVLNRTTCEKMIRHTPLGITYNLPLSSICADYDEKNVFCDGYKGSPLICPIAGQKNRYVQAGSFSWITMCNKKDVPHVYGNIANARTWIDNQMAVFGFDKSSYINGDEKSDKTPAPLKPRRCGLIGNNGNFPWVVAISMSGASVDYQCTGSLIHPKVILTAAQCVEGKKSWDLKVIAGRWFLDNSTGNWPHQNRNVSEIIIHDDYSRSSFKNDFALLVLLRPFMLADNINTICMPRPNVMFDGSRSLIDDYVTLVREYSIAKFRGSEISSIHLLNSKPRELEVLTRFVCTKLMQATPLGTNYDLIPSSICAGDVERRAQCNSRGSPLVRLCPGSDERYVQIGLFSWTTICNTKNVPGIYGNVAAARNWIDRRFERLGFDSSYYLEPTE